MYTLVSGLHRKDLASSHFTNPRGLLYLYNNLKLSYVDACGALGAYICPCRFEIRGAYFPVDSK